jgi:hypothetical protein
LACKDRDQGAGRVAGRQVAAGERERCAWLPIGQGTSRRPGGEFAGCSRWSCAGCSRPEAGPTSRPGRGRRPPGHGAAWWVKRAARRWMRRWRRPWWVAGGRRGVGLDGVEAALDHLDEQQVGGDHPKQDEEEADGQGGEPEEASQRGERQDRADERPGHGRDQHWHARAAAEERDPPGADNGMQEVRGSNPLSSTLWN